MMTPRGVADVMVYTPERVELRYGVTPAQVPDFIGLKGDTSDNIPGVPGIGDKTAGQLIQQHGSLEAVLDAVDTFTPARAKALRENAAAGARLEAPRDDAPRPRARLRPGGARPRAAGPSQLKEMFRRFEFRGLLSRIDSLDEALPAAERPQLEGVAVPVGPGRAARRRRGARASRTAGRARDRRRRDGRGVEHRRRPALRDRRLVAHDFKRLPRELLRAGAEPAEDTLIAAYLIEPGRSAYDLDDLAAEYGLELQPDPPAEEETAALVRHAETTRRLAELLAPRLAERGLDPLYREIELPLVTVLAAMEDAGVKIDAYRMGEITARLRDRVEELEVKAIELAGEPFLLGSTQQVARILFEKLGLQAGRKGKTGYSTDTRVLRSIRGDHEIVPVIEEWRELSKLLNTYLGPLPDLLGEDGRLHTTFNQTVAATGRLSTTNPNLQSIPIRTELGREIRSAFVAEPGHKLISADYSQVELRILAHVSGEPRLREAFARGRGHPRGDRLRGARHPAGGADEGRAQPRQGGQLRDHLRHLRLRPLRQPGDLARGGADLHRHVSGALPARAGLHPAHDRAGDADGYVTTLLGRRRPVPEIRASNRQTRSLGERLAVNSVMQGTAADVIKVAMVRIHDRLRAEGRAARLVLQVHDELLLEARRRGEPGKELVREELCNAFELDPPLAVDVGSGEDWSRRRYVRRTRSEPVRPEDVAVQDRRRRAPATDCGRDGPDEPFTAHARSSAASGRLRQPARGGIRDGRLRGGRCVTAYRSPRATWLYCALAHDQQYSRHAR